MATSNAAALPTRKYVHYQYVYVKLQGEEIPEIKVVKRIDEVHRLETNYQRHACIAPDCGAPAYAQGADKQKNANAQYQGAKQPDNRITAV